MTTNNEVSEDVLDVAKQIVNYLDENSNSADTIDGIVNWWLLRQRLQEEKTRVKNAVNYLYEEGLVEKRILADGRELLFRAKKNV